MTSTDKELIRQRKELAGKVIRRLKCCIVGNCEACDLNTHFDDGICCEDTMSEAVTLLKTAYFTDTDIRGDENNE